MKKKYYIVMDTETTGNVNHPIAYNWGWIVTDKKGKIYEKRSFLIKELWIDNFDMVKECFYKNKLPMYFMEVANGETEIKPLRKILEIFTKDYKKYNKPMIGAYNMAFDDRAIENTFNFCDISFKGMKKDKIFCIMNLAEQTLMSRPTYFLFGKKHNLFTDKGNLKTSAEACYRYLANDNDFIEVHMALQDCEIEAVILTACLKQKKKMDWKKFGPVWQKVNKKYKKYFEE